ncbi:MAG: tetratricopeptide repeat protein [Gemmatimonadetes bacterium]|nr:tetratricopeptide repeat protein [Gemmatimonadota bacterium]
MSQVATAPRRPYDAWLGLLLLVAIVIAYWPALGGGLVWDDDAHVTRTALRSLDGLRRIWFDVGSTQQYYPLLHSAFWLESRLWGDQVVGYHLTNVFLHFINSALIVLLAQRLRIRGAWLAGFLFALHPVHVESVAWISEQKNTLSLAFYLSSALVYLRFDEGRARRDYALALALFVLALLTKTVTATLPAALLVVFWWRRGTLGWRRDALPLVPWFILAAAGGLFTAWVERHIIGAEGAEYGLGLAERALLSARVIGFYLSKLFWPVDLAFTYPRWTIEVSAVASWLRVAGVAALTAALWLSRRRTRGPIAAFLILCGSLFPVLGFLDIYPFRYTYVADHFLYLASVAVIVATASVITLAAEWVGGGGLARAGADVVEVGRTRWIGAALVVALVVALLGALLGALGMQTWRQAGNYTDAETLYRATLQRNPDSWKEHNNLGRLLARSPRRMPEAITHYEAAIRLKSDHLQAHYSLGVALFVTGRRADAVAPFRRVLELSGGQSLVAANSHYFIGTILTDEPGRLDEAIAELEQAVQMKPDDGEARANLAAALERKARGGS